MNYKDIQSALEALERSTYEFENLMEENGGEFTPEAEQLEAQRQALTDLLSGDGIDTLGRWLKSKEDEKATYKAEKAAADARIKSVDKTIDFIKHEISRILMTTGQEKAKGSFYSFAVYTSVKTSVNTEALDSDYLDLVTEAARNAGLPGYIDVALKTTATRVRDWAEEHEGEGSGYYEVATDETVKFTKPRTPKE